MMLMGSLVLLLALFSTCTSLDTISSSYILNASETLSSSNGLFHLGFFTPTNSSTFSSYLGIWFMTKPSVVWVANRNQPITDSSSSGLLKISKDGNLVVMNSKSVALWSTKASNISSNTLAKLLNNGNLLLQENSTGRILWQSFQHPTNTFLQGMELGTGNISGERIKLTSWRSPQDPSIGEFSVSLEHLNIPEVMIWRGSQPHWRSGPWNSQKFLGIPDMRSNFLSGFYLGVEDMDNGITNYYLAYNYSNNPESVYYYMLSTDGNLHETYWDHEKGEWLDSWLAINSECDVYGKCGEFGICDSTNSPICSCLRGYKPRNPEEWNKQNWSRGCIRKEPFQCENESLRNNKEDGFVKLQNAKVPASIKWLSTAIGNDCKGQCLGDCSCTAYAYDAGTGCMVWTANLTDIQSFSAGGIDLYIRVPNSELGEDKKNVTVVIAVPVIVGAAIILICAYIFWKRIQIREKAKNKPRRKDNDLVKFPELSQFEFKRLVAATNNFNLSNKLGEGGYGPVYKGTLEDGQEIAVKRLSRSSGQGYEEFMNEVMVISKLQHFNLVRLFGCCIEGDEKILIYEYMPNKSLDAYMFDQSQILNWEKRFSIIEGIARGLLYLHRDSRLRIIHRDLKMSNILLDEELNPKIADFGMAKIFTRTQDVVNTRRVVGTYGYMSPEYVIQGLFSEKSDVFSFGVLLLEIVSKRKNSSFYEDAESLNLLGFAWNLWNADNIASLIDPEISSSCNKEDIMRCIHIGLLCVQELARDRPTMTSVISMFKSETINLPPPKQPAFILRQTIIDIESSLTNKELGSINNVTLTNIQGR
ncbi:G-type lectin S-receptor-like serine/threonine-protein kinase [Arachis hypogaea]|nr:G-type lectin S-receptor-like serine/threonine-protein kinase [Arachis hypogaea]